MRRHAVIAALLVASISCSLPTQVCYMYLDSVNTFIKIDEFQAKQNYVNKVMVDGQEATLQYNYCASAKAPEGCQNNGYTFAYLIQGKECTAIGNENMNANWDSRPFDNKKGLEQDAKAKTKTGYSIDLGFKCDSNSKKFVAGNFTYDAATRTFKVVNTSKSACGQDFGDIVSFIEKYKVIAAVLILIGIFLCFFGIKFVKIALATLGFITAGAASAYLINIFFNLAAVETGKLILALVVILVVACLFAFLFYYFTKISFLLAGGALGLEVSFLLVGLINAGSGTNQLIIQIVAGVILTLVGAFVGYKLHDHVVIISTGLSGGNLVIFGIGSIVGNYPSWTLIAEKIKAHALTGTPAVAYAYLAGGIVLSIVGIVIQYKYIRSTKDEDKKEEYGKAPQGNNYGEYL
jgi:hypothetical protein